MDCTFCFLRQAAQFSKNPLSQGFIQPRQIRFCLGGILQIAHGFTPTQDPWQPLQQNRLRHPSRTALRERSRAVFMPWRNSRPLSGPVRNSANAISTVSRIKSFNSSTVRSETFVPNTSTSSNNSLTRSSSPGSMRRPKIKNPVCATVLSVGHKQNLVILIPAVVARTFAPSVRLRKQIAPHPFQQSGQDSETRQHNLPTHPGLAAEIGR